MSESENNLGWTHWWCREKIDPRNPSVYCYVENEAKQVSCRGCGKYRGKDDWAYRAQYVNHKLERKHVGIFKSFTEVDYEQHLE